MRTIALAATLLALTLIGSGCSQKPADTPANVTPPTPIEQTEVTPSDVPEEPAAPADAPAPVDGPAFPEPSADSQPKVLGAVGKSLFSAAAGGSEEVDEPPMDDAPPFEAPAPVIDDAPE